MQSLFILGRQPALGLAELESLYGPAALTPVGKGGALLDVEPRSVAFDRLGGSVKLAEVIQTHGTTVWHEIEPHLAAVAKKLAASLPEGKIRLGISTYGIRTSPQDINRAGLALKKVLKAEGLSVRIIPNKFPELNSAQVLHNQLTGPSGIELVIARNGSQVIIGRTIAEQDIEAYAKRDQNRPARDAKVGMLPPKLAQIIINLTGSSSAETVLDPFCGTGVLLQEALLMGYCAYGTDLEPRMIEYTQKNLDWLAKYDSSILPVHNFTTLSQADATTFNWNAAKLKPLGPDEADYPDGYLTLDNAVVACETFLGKPLSSLPARHMLDQIMHECNLIHEKFLHNIGSQIAVGTRLALGVPAWKTKDGFLHLKILDLLDELGYNRQKFVHARNEELIYHRPDQVVARELVVLEKK